MYDVQLCIMYNYDVQLCIMYNYGVYIVRLENSKIQVWEKC